MYKIVKRGALLLLIAGLAVGMANCSDDDPDYENVTPPEIVVAPNTLTGVITSISGDVVVGATVTLGSATAKSDANGIYLFGDVKAGTYQIKAEAEGKLAQEGEITVAADGKSQNLVWNATLTSDVKVEVAVSATEETKAEVTNETTKDNKAAEVKIEAAIPAGAVVAEEGEEVKIEITPTYDASSTVKTRTTESTMMVGAALACSKKDAVLTKSIDLGFDVDEELAASVEARQYKDGQWVAVESRVENGKVIIVANEFTSYGLFLGVSFTASSGSEDISFGQSKWDNLYGANEMSVGAASYTYKVGAEIATKGTDKLTALLVEKLAQRYGSKISNVNGSYPLNVTLPVGTMLSLAGAQNKQTVAASAAGKSASGSTYGTVTVVVTTANRQHSGGTN